LPQEDPMNATVQKPASSRIHWLNVLTVLSAAILIGAEVFGAAFAAGWAIGTLAHGYIDIGPYTVHVFQGVFFLCGVYVMVRFILNAQRVEPFVDR
jgi:hypothetical protein